MLDTLTLTQRQAALAMSNVIGQVAGRRVYAGYYSVS